MNFTCPCSWKEIMNALESDAENAKDDIPKVIPILEVIEQTLPITEAVINPVVVVLKAVENTLKSKATI